MITHRTARFPLLLASAAALLTLAPRARAADNKDMLSLQRDVASLEETMKTLQTSLTGLQTTVDDKLGAISALQQKTLDRVNQNHTDDDAAAKDLASQFQQKVVIPVAGISAKLDQLSTQVSTAGDNLADFGARLGRLEQRMVDLESAMKVIQSPPAAPPPAGAPTADGLPPGVTAQGLFQSAAGDQLAGHSDMALTEYQQYLKYFGDTDTAPNAQFEIGEIQLNQGNLDEALQAFDTVLSQYPKSPKAPDALYLKAQALKKQGKRLAATQALNQLIRQYPDSDAAANAKADLPAPKRPAAK